MAARPRAPSAGAGKGASGALPSSVSATLLSQVGRVLDRCDQDYLQRNIPNITTAELSAALQHLLNETQIRVVRGKNNELSYLPVRGDVAQAIKALDPEEMVVYRLVEAAQREGIWAKTLKTKANLSRTFPKVIKHLETKKLVKCFKSITSKYKKIYILFDLEPAEHHRGGVWYDSKLEFDKSFVQALKEMTLKYIRANGLATIADVKRHIESTGVSHVALTDEEVRTLVHTLIYDGLVEQTLASGPAHSLAHDPAATTAYKPAHAHDRDAAAALTLGSVALTPCTRCPVAHLCGKTADITPATCVYLTPFLDF